MMMSHTVMLSLRACAISNAVVCDIVVDGVLV